MTSEEKHSQMTRRNADICAYYQAGYKLKECASKYGLGRQRVLQILQQAGVWKPYVKLPRKFLGVNISSSVKDALTREAGERSITVSQLVSDKLEESFK